MIDRVTGVAGAVVRCCANGNWCATRAASLRLAFLVVARARTSAGLRNRKTFASRQSQRVVARRVGCVHRCDADDRDGSQRRPASGKKIFGGAEDCAPKCLRKTLHASVSYPLCNVTRQIGSAETALDRRFLTHVVFLLARLRRLKSSPRLRQIAVDPPRDACRRCRKVMQSTLQRSAIGH